MQGDLNIDEYEQWSLDKAKIGDHYYTDKAPFTTYLLLAVAAPLDFLSVFDHSRLIETYRGLIGLGAVICGSVPFLAVLFMCYAKARRFVGESEAMIITMLLVYGSNLYVYAGVLWGHMLCGALLVVGLHLLVDRNAPFAAGLARRVRCRGVSRCTRGAGIRRGRHRSSSKCASPPRPGAGRLSGCGRTDDLSLRTHGLSLRAPLSLRE
jgi:hypothetical protein